MQVENVRADITKGISDAGKKLPHRGKKLPHMGNVPHDDNPASPDIEKSLAHVRDVLMHVNSASRELGEDPFELLFSLPDMHEENLDVLFSRPDMHEGRNDVVFFLREVHPALIQHEF